jgi:hydrogenase nickel incorporation protein HypA/HybF
VHEKALMDDLMAKILSVADAEGGARVVRIRVHLGALSHFTPGHFREHFEDAARGTLAEGAEIDADVGTDVAAPGAAGVVLEAVEVEAGGPSARKPSR